MISQKGQTIETGFILLWKNKC